MHTLFSNVACALDKKFKVSLLAFDCSSAFDTVSRDVMESKLGWTDLSARSLLMNYMTQRSQRVKWNSSTPKVLNIRYGVTQGSILAPLMFIILTGDLPNVITEKVDSKTSCQ